MIYDTFLFNNELDLLEIRFNILNDYVDFFVLIEARETFSGISKPLHYEENKERYKKWEHKIIHFVVDNSDDELWKFSKSSPNVGSGEHWWVREFYQKENILKALNGKAKDEDIIFVSDCDEIWDPLKIPKEFDLSRIYWPVQIGYHYYLNNKSNHDISGWQHTRFGAYKMLKKYGANHFRAIRLIDFIKIQDGGWHFSNLGGFDFIKTKVESYGHQEYNNSQVKDRIQNCIDSNCDFLNRGFKLWVDENGLPEYILKNKNKWIHLFKQ